MLSKVSARLREEREPTSGSDGHVQPPRTNQMVIQGLNGLLVFPIKLEIWRRKYQ